MLPVDKWKNLAVEEFYHPTYLSYLRAFMDFTFVISACIFSFTTYVIFTQSTSAMKTFKYTIFFQTTFNFLAEFWLFIYCPIVLFPLPIVGFYSHFPVTMDHLYAQATVLYVVTMGAIFAFLNTLFFRVIAIFDFPFLYKIPHRKILFILFNVFMFILVLANLLISLYKTDRNPEEYNARIEALIPAMKDLHKTLPNTYGAIPGFNSAFLELHLSSVIFWMSVAASIVIVFNGIFYFRMKKIKHILRRDTFAVHIMLHRTLIAQMIVVLVFVAIPVLALVALAWTQSKNGSWYANLVPPIVSMHITFDALCLFCYVKPYRKFLLKKFSCILRRRRRRHQIISPINFINSNFPPP